MKLIRIALKRLSQVYVHLWPGEARQPGAFLATMPVYLMWVKRPNVLTQLKYRGSLGCETLTKTKGGYTNEYRQSGFMIIKEKKMIIIPTFCQMYLPHQVIYYFHLLNCYLLFSAVNHLFSVRNSGILTISIPKMHLGSYKSFFFVFEPNS